VERARNEGDQERSIGSPDWQSRRWITLEMLSVFIAVVSVLLLAILWLPSLAVLIFGRQRPFAQAMRKVWPLWIAQPVAAAALIWLADETGLVNPAGYVFAICMAIGGGGALTVAGAMRRI
jgi:hypothetical protein